MVFRFIQAITNITAAAIAPNRETQNVQSTTETNQQKNDAEDSILSMLERDFSYVTSNNSKPNENELVSEITTRIALSIKKLTQNIATHFQRLENNLQEDTLAESADQFKAAYSYLLDIKKQLENSASLADFIEQIILEMALKLNVTFESSIVSEIKKYKEYLEFLQKKNSNLIVPSWSSGFAANELVYLDSLQRWYTFYSKFYDTLCSYEVQKNHQNYNIGEFTMTIDRLLADPKRTEFSIQQIGLKKFVEQFQTLGNLEPTIITMTINRFKAENMLKMVKTSFTYTVQVLPSANNVTIQGRFVIFSNVMDHLTNEDFKTIEIFATKTVFIDRSLNRTNTLKQLAIVAPKWQIIADAHSVVEIILNGANVQPRNEDQGGAGGSFLGLGNTFVSTEKLAIFANGGNASSGYTEEMNYNHVGFWNQSCHSKFDDSYDRAGYYLGYDYKLLTISACMEVCPYINGPLSMDVPPSPVSKYRENFCCALNTSDVSHIGGGYPGDHGAIVIMTLPSGKLPFGIFLSVQKGTSCHSHQTAVSAKYTVEKFWHDYQYCVVRSCQYLSKKPELTDWDHMTKNLTDPGKIIQRFKEFLREEILKNSDNLQETLPQKFLAHLETNPNVTNWYTPNILELAADLQILERQYLKFANQVNPSVFLPYYRYFYDHVRAAANNLKNNSDPDLKLLYNYLSAAAMTKINALNYQKPTNLIIDITPYLDQLLERIKEYKNFKRYVQKANTHDQFQQQIRKAIEEAHDIVINSVNTEIDKIFVQLNKDTTQVINDVEQAEKEAKDQVKQLTEYREKLKNSIIATKILDIIQITGSLLSFLGPVGVGIGAVLGGGTALAKDVVAVDDLENLGNLPSSSSLTNMVGRLKREGQTFKEQLTEGIALMEQTAASDDEVQQLKKEFQSVVETIREMENKNEFQSVSPTEVLSQRQELSQKLDKRAKASKSEKMIKLSVRLQAVIGLTGEFYNLYKQHKKDESKLAKLNTAIEEAEKAAYQLDQFKQAIYTDMVPMFRNIQSNVKNLGQRLQNDSHASLAVAKWNIQRNLDKAIRMLADISKTFNVAADMANCIKQVQKGAELTINIYDTIQDYEDRSQMVSYIYDMSRDDLGQITNASVRSALEHTTKLVETNIIMGEYFNAMSAIKTYVFPFPNYFLGNVYSLPTLSSTDLGSDAGLEELVINISQNITHINKEIKKDNLQVKGEYDQYIHQTEFTFSKSTAPFYTWKNDPNLVRRLLRGEEITVSANVRDQMKNAVKFKEIGIYLRIQPPSRNITALDTEEAQKNLDTELQGYQVFMTHTGDSYFRCDNLFYIIHTNDHLTFSYTLEKNEKGESRDKNNVYVKISKGVHLLSPYTTWRIQLRPVRPVLNWATRNVLISKQFWLGDLSKIASEIYLNKSEDSESKGKGHSRSFSNSKLYGGPTLRAFAGFQPYREMTLRPFAEFEPFFNNSIALELVGKGQYVDPDGGPKICGKERVPDYYQKAHSNI